MKFTRSAKFALAVASATGLVVGLTAPAVAATRTTVVIVASNALTSLNPGTPTTNLVTNSDVAYLSGSGFTYYDDKKNLVRNTTFGTFKVVKNTNSDFRVQYTVNAGRLWSDGTPITGEDLLLSHILSSSDYSKAAGLGDPSDSKDSPAFDSSGYGGVYDESIVGEPTLSADKQSVTLRFNKKIPDWELYGPGPSPVHTLVLLADGESKLGAAAANEAARDRFVKAFQTKDATLLKKIGKIWSESYNIKTINDKTNPLLLVGNGGFQISSAVADQNVTLKLNPKYNSGPKTSGIETIVFKFMSDGTAAAQALANKEIDVYQGQPTADAVAQLKAIKGVTVIGGTNACYEHVDLRVGPAFGTTDTYNGPFAASSGQKGKDLRTAFLLAYPREEIVEKLIKPINSSAVVVNSLWTLPGTDSYSKIVGPNGVTKYTTGTQEKRTAQALALVKKYFPGAKAGSGSVKVNLLWGQPNNARRAAEAALVKAALAKAGFDVNTAGTSGWSAYLDSSKFDAAFFAWCPSAVTQSSSRENFQSDGGNNLIGYNNPAVDSIVKKLLVKQTDSQITAIWIQAERLIMADAVSLPIFQHPAATAVNSDLVGIKPAPLTPNLVWNYWDWHY
jgi:peptide/nickel transport system substrate-binding protein